MGSYTPGGKPPRTRTGHHRSKPPRRRPASKIADADTTQSVHQLKTRVRDLTRLLAKPDRLPAGVLVDKERELASCKQDVAKAQQDQRRRKLLPRYHKVRFFERQKASRRLKKARARLVLLTSAADSTGADKAGEVQQAQTAVHVGEVDLNYTIYHPLDEKYTGLFSASADHGADTDPHGADASGSIEQKPDMWRVVEKCMQDGTLQDLRDGKTGHMYTQQADSHAQQQHSSITGKAGRAVQPTAKWKDSNLNGGKGVGRRHAIGRHYDDHDDDDDDDDEGFFET